MANMRKLVDAAFPQWPETWRFNLAELDAVLCEIEQNEVKGQASNETLPSA